MADVLLTYKTLPKKEQNLVFKLSEPIKVSSFIKYFREKYRLCWKEIYNKFRAIIYKPE